MQKGIKNTGFFLLSFAGLIFFLHAIIPHHHHYNSTPVCNQQTNTNHQGDTSQDCHAFNDLVIDKPVISGNHQLFSEIVLDLAAEINTDIPVIGMQIDSAVILTENDKTPAFPFLKSYPVRGSPISV